MRDVALVPERVVLERGGGVAAKQAREPDDLLAADRVSLVGHRRRALLPLAERLFDLADLGLLKSANLERELLERRTNDGEHRDQLGVAIALDHLRRDRRRRQTQRSTDVALDRRRQVRERADRARQLADGDDLARAPETHDVSSELGVPQRELETEGHRLGMHAVRASDHRRASMLQRPGVNGLHQPIEIGEEQVARLAHLDRLRGVDDVGGGQAEVQPARRGADMLGHGGRERDDVVLGDFFDLLDARDVEGAAFADVARRIGRDDSRPRHGLGCGHFDLQPGLVLPLVAPDATHFRMRITPDHLSEITLVDDPHHETPRLTKRATEAPIVPAVSPGR